MTDDAIDLLNAHRLNLPTITEARRQWEESRDRPFPHLIAHDVIPDAVAELIGDEFPDPTSTGWHTFTGLLEEGKQEGTAAIAGLAVAVIHDWLADDAFIAWLRAVTGIADLIADPDRVGGGIHQSGPDARLGRHVDFNLHPRRPDLVRAVNLILFVGDHERWDRDWGGLLELGNLNGPLRYIREVSPMPGTLVIFESTDTSWHGHPVPMTADAPLRKSIPAYYYRPIRDGEQIGAHSTRFMES